LRSNQVVPNVPFTGVNSGEVGGFDLPDFGMEGRRGREVSMKYYHRLSYRPNAH